MLASLAAAVVVLATAAGTRAVEPSGSPNRLDHPYVDLVLLEPAGPDAAPRLLVIDAGTTIDPIHLSVLERDREWSEVRSLDVDLDTESRFLDAPWLIPLGPSTVALLATVSGAELTHIVMLRTDGGQGGDELVEASRTDIQGRVTAGGAADVDGDGVAELVLGSRVGCGNAAISVLRADVGTETPQQHLVPGVELRGGVIGRWDETPGDDLLVWAAEGCVEPATEAAVRLDAIRLVDGTSTRRLTDVAPMERDFLGAPLRLDLDALDPAAPPLDEAVIRGRDGLTLLDPAHDWSATVVARGDTIPLGVSLAPDAGSPALLYMDFERDAVVARSALRRDTDGTPELVTRVQLPVEGQVPDRMRRLAGQAAIGIMGGRPGVVWQGSIGQEGCPDVLVQGARIRCDGNEFEPGAAWIGTRPLATLGEGSSRRLLVAAGMAFDANVGLPIVPSPAATAVPGWWRQGPSATFTLAEVRAGDAMYYGEFPEPRSSVEHVSNPDATTALPGFTGTRLLVRAEATVTAEEPSRDLALEEVFTAPADGRELRTILRIPVPPGLDSGRDGAAVLVPLADATLPDGTAGTQWALQVVPINDWGEVGPMAVGLVERDATGPTLVVGEPFTTPVWPLPARLTGSAEPGSMVTIDGIGIAPLDRRGGFEFQTTLAPWPQTVRIRATDASGNQTVRELSIIGGVDYRRFPWTVIAAVVIVVAVGASGFRGVRRRPVGAGLAASGGGAVTFIEEWPMAELEELEPGAGLPKDDGSR